MDALANKAEHEEVRAMKEGDVLLYEGSGSFCTDVDSSFWSLLEPRIDEELFNFTTRDERKLIAIGLIAGLIHNLFFQTILQTSVILGSAIPQYHPNGHWLAAGSAGALLGCIYYFTRINPVQLPRMKICCDVLIVTGTLMYLNQLACYNGLITKAVCTMIGTGIFFCCEAAKGYIMCLNFGINTYYTDVGMSSMMSIANSVGAVLVAMIPWFLTVTMQAFGVLDSAKGNIISLGLIYGVAVILCFIYRSIVTDTFDNRNCSLGHSYHTTHTEKTMSIVTNEADGIQPSVIKTLLQAFKGTRTCGFTISFSFIFWFIVFPDVFPFAFKMPKVHYQLLLGISNIFDPIIRCFGFSIERFMGGKRMKRRHYLFASLFVALSVVPICLLPFYYPDHPYFQNLNVWHYGCLMSWMTVTHAGIVIVGVYCYMSNLPDNDSKEFSSGLMAIYMMGGVAIGQLASLVVTRNHYTYA